MIFSCLNPNRGGERVQFRLKDASMSRKISDHFRIRRWQQFQNYNEQVSSYYNYMFNRLKSAHVVISWKFCVFIKTLEVSLSNWSELRNLKKIDFTRRQKSLTAVKSLFLLLPCCPYWYAIQVVALRKQPQSRSFTSWKLTNLDEVLLSHPFIRNFQQLIDQ